MTTGRKLALGLAVAALLVGGISWAVLHSAELHLVNGLSFPVVVTVDGTPHTLEPGSRKVLSGLTSGAHELVATRADGKDVERLTPQLSLSDANVYSVLGAAPVERATVYYGTPGSTPEPQTQSACGGPPFQVFDVNFAFEEPPRTVEVPSGSSYSSRTVLRLSGEGLAGCLASPRVEPVALAELAAKVAAVTPTHDERRALLSFSGEAFARGGHPERALEQAKALLDDPASTLEDHRVVQDLFGAAHQRESLIERYRARFEAKPGAEAAYLYARLLDAADALPVVDAALKDAPDDPWLHRTRLWCADQLLHWDDVVVESGFFEKHAELKDVQGWAFVLRMRALVALGRGGEALDGLKAKLDGEPRWSPADAILVERVAARAGAKPWVEPFSRVSDPASSASERALFKYFYELSAGHPSPARPPGQTLNAFEVLEAARRNPTQALEKLKALGSTQQLYFVPEQAWVLLAEAWRVGDDAAADKLSRFAQGGGDGAALKRFIDAGDEAGLRDATQEARLALLLARSRTLAARGDADGAKATEARLEANDPLKGLAVLALTEWKRQDAPKAEAVQQLQQTGALPGSMRTVPKRK